MAKNQKLTIGWGKKEIDGVPSYAIKRGATFLATVTFDGPRKTLRVHEGGLGAEDRKEVYAIARAGLPTKAGEARHV